MSAGNALIPVVARALRVFLVLLHGPAPCPSRLSDPPGSGRGKVQPGLGEARVQQQRQGDAPVRVDLKRARFEY